MLFSSYIPSLLLFGVCLKKAFCMLYDTLCGRFVLNEGNVAGYASFI
ncbi:DUF6783 domain-containing protein [uncultured Robinsoniella sp.]